MDTFTQRSVITQPVYLFQCSLAFLQRNILLIFTKKDPHVAEYKSIAFYKEFLLQEIISC